MLLAAINGNPAVRTLESNMRGRHLSGVMVGVGTACMLFYESSAALYLGDRRIREGVKEVVCVQHPLWPDILRGGHLAAAAK